MNRNRRVARWGEDAAADYLTSRGYRILARNVRTPYGEIDLVAEIEDLTVFVEVKTRTSRVYGLPEEALTPRKRRHMRDSAAHYAAEHGLETWQCDAIAVEGAPGLPPRIEHFENVTADLG